MVYTVHKTNSWLNAIITKWKQNKQKWNRYLLIFTFQIALDIDSKSWYLIEIEKLSRILFDNNIFDDD